MLPAFRHRTLAALLGALTLVGCGGAQQEGNALASLDTRLTNDMPAAEKTVADRPAPKPADQEPAAAPRRTLGELTEAQKAEAPRAVARLADNEGRAVGGCAGRGLRYGAEWAEAMPDGLTLYPGATLAEAAGTDTGRCALRVVSFTTADSPERVVAHYAARVRAAGFDAERQPCRGEIRLGGTRAGDDAAYMLFARRRDGVTEVDIVASAGATRVS